LSPSRSASSRDRLTAWLREETPSFRWIDMARDLTVCGDRNMSAAISVLAEA
jgi:hypothetical protein